MKLYDYIEEYFEECRKQIIADQERWGDTWKERPRAGQVDRMMARFADYEDQHHNGGQPFPWTKVFGESLIGWVRDNYPDTYMLDDEDA